LRHAAAWYRTRAALPSDVAALRPGQDPLIEEDAPHVASGRGPDGAGPVLRAAALHAIFEAPEPVVVHAWVEDDAGSRSSVEWMTVHLRHATGAQPMAVVPAADDGANGDGAAGDSLYTAVYAPATPERFAGVHGVEVEAVLHGGEARGALTGFLYSAPGARLTGRLVDDVEDGALVIAVGLHVERTGRYHVEGTLYDARDDPIAWAQAAAPLGPGPAELRLRFFGKVLVDAGRDGPYALRSLRLTEGGRMPAMRGRRRDPGFTTAAWPVARFSPEPFDDPAHLAMAERLDAARTGK
jgi:hypothetical protein